MPNHIDPQAPQATDLTERLNRVGRICDRLDISRTKLDHLVQHGELDVVMVGAHRRITESSLMAYIERHRV